MIIRSIIRIASAIITDASGRCLLVRKKGTTHFIQPGGKIENDETPLAALQRELFEELRLNTHQEQFDYVGCFEEKAVNEAECTLSAEIYHLHIESQDCVPAAEVEETLWYSFHEQKNVLIAPLTTVHLLPLVEKLARDACLAQDFRKHKFNDEAGA
ncbi:NUDIX domain-containing protein [Pantoea agglomerans]|uniref:NUDIX hydrolase n=1 Tax=Enterobacter agglomerans TaxID=549 RepID=UPI0013C1C7F3|nr:NUDIX domain-containing protein [Pantoea agglomerans]NEH20508.1 NUDIX domain-containing protein [Pantoea agglomerans]